MTEDTYLELQYDRVTKLITAQLTFCKYCPADVQDSSDKCQQGLFENVIMSSCTSEFTFALGEWTLTHPGRVVIQK